jgi:FlaA1/EpsC-like NDP-sugar epimerase
LKINTLKKSQSNKNSFHLKNLFNLKRLSFLPNWIVLILDIIIILFSGTLTFFLFQELHLHYIHPNYLVIGFIYYLTLNVFFFLLFNTHSGIIRHSSNIDALKLFFSQFFTFGVIVATNYVLIFLGKGKLILTTASFFNATLSLGLLMLFRITVKQIFEKYINSSENKNKIRAIIYGLDSNAISIANALLSENPRRFNVIGFIDNTNQNSDKRILNLPIFEIKKSIPLTMRLVKAEALILADSLLSTEERNKIGENCIDYNFKIFVAPLVSNFENQQSLIKNIKSFEISDLLERSPIVLDTKLISNHLNNKTILVTGAAGSIGSEIVRQIINFNAHKIILLDQSETPLHNIILEIKSLEKNVIVETVLGDIRNHETTEQIFKKSKPNIVFHAAAYKHVPLMEENPNQAILTNILGTKNIADLSSKYDVENFIMISTDKAVNPSSIMGASKRIAEMYIQSKHFKFKKINTDTSTKYITTRFGNVLGSNGSVVPLFTKQIKEGGPITLTHPDIIRYFMTIPEACQLVLEASSMGLGGEIFIFDMGKPVKIIDLAKKMIRLEGLIPDKDILIKIIGLRPGEKLYEELFHQSAKNLETHHEKILIAEEICDDYDTINTKIEILIKNATENNNSLIIESIKELVPEYKCLDFIDKSIQI